MRRIGHRLQAGFEKVGEAGWLLRRTQHLRGRRKVELAIVARQLLCVRMNSARSMATACSVHSAGSTISNSASPGKMATSEAPMALPLQRTGSDTVLRATAKTSDSGPAVPTSCTRCDVVSLSRASTTACAGGCPALVIYRRRKGNDASPVDPGKGRISSSASDSPLCQASRAYPHWYSTS